jgi:hypothetical protein
MKLQAFLNLLVNFHRTSRGFLASCPGHDDQHPSLLVTETKDRILIHCRAGCRTSDVLSAMELNYSDLFYDNGKTKGAIFPTGPRHSEPAPSFYWNWRSQCAELERLIQEKREHAEAMLSATQGLDVNALTAPEFDEVMDYVGRAYSWLDRCERLDETLFLVQQDLRAEELARRAIDRREKVAV